MESYSPAQKDALLELYREEIEQRLQYLNETMAASLLQLMPKGKLETMRDDKENLDALGEQLWFELTTSPLKECLYDALLQYFSDVDDKDMHRVLALDNRRSHFNVLLANFEDFLQYLSCENCLEYLRTIGYYLPVITSIEQAFKDTEDIVRRKRIILRTIGPIGAYSVYDILYTIYSISDEAAAFVERISPNFERFYKWVDRDRKDPRGQVRLWSSDSDLSTFLTQSSSEKQSTIVDLNYDDFSDKGDRKVLLSTIDNKMYKERPLNLREYQKELCEDATEGRNCIICAPTGSGKTIVAAYIIKNHLMIADEEKKPRKVLFMICNTAVIDQQKDQIEKFVGHRFEVDAISGEDNRPIRELIYAKDVVVCTPQMIVNLLNNNSLGDSFESSSRPFSIDDFSLIIFDECHNTKKDTPYSNIMRHYHRKMTCRLLLRPPQIVGLTASLGVGKDAKDHRKALRHIIELCALLDSPTISLVRNNTAELMSFSPPTADEFIDCSNADDHDADRVKFQQLLRDFMKQLEVRMYQLFETEHVLVMAPISEIDEERPIKYKSITSPPADKSSEEYCAWIAQHRNTIIPESSLEPNTKRQVTEIFECLMILYRSLELFFNFTSKDSFNYMVDKLAVQIDHLSTPISRLYEIYKPKLEKLISEHCSLITVVEELILEQNAKAPESRSIIFVKTRRGTRVLTDLLNNRSGLKKERINSEALSGLNKTTNNRDIDKNSRREQAETLDRFRSAATRVLVSTSVAEEGLDIAQCSLVIKYNYSTNEIAHVQRRGRGRAVGSRCILVTNQPKIGKQEEGNIMKERLMKQAIACIENREIDLATNVCREIAKLRDTISQKDKEKEDRVQQQKTMAVQYDILCKKCETFLCSNEEIKVEKSYYMVCNPDFWKKCTPRQIPVESQKRYAGAATLICSKIDREGNEKTCGNDLGTVVRILDTNMPVLQAQKIILRKTKEGTKKTVKQWKDIHELFHIDSIRNLELALMQENSPHHVSLIQFSGVDRP